MQTDLAPRRVMEKAGFVYEREVVPAGLPPGLYHITASEGEGKARHSKPTRREK